MSKALTKKLLSVALCLSMVLTSIVMLPSGAYAETADTDLNTVRGAAWLKANTGTECIDTFYYSDDLFKESSLEYNNSLATTSVDLAASSLMTDREPDTAEGYANMHRNVRAFLEDNGFVDFAVNNEYKTYSSGSDGAAVACAHKKITAGGKTYTLLALVPRSGTFGTEFGYDFMLSKDENDTGDFYDFTNRREAILDYAKNYISGNGISGDIKVWIVGYSRGAGVVNLVGAELIDHPERLGTNVTLKADDLYCYTFGTPNPASVSSSYSDEKYNYIHNIFDHNDLYATIPPAAMGVNRYGANYQLSSPENKERMLSFLKDISEKDYEKYLASDPADYTPLKLDTKALLKGSLSFVPDEESYLPYDLHDFNVSIGETFANLTARSSKSGKNSREGYYREYQEPMIHLGQYIVEDVYHGNDAVVSSLKNDKRLIPLAMTMYLTFLADKHFADKNADINSHLEGAFNIFAMNAENPDGTLKKEYTQVAKSYYALRDLIFDRSETPEIVDDITMTYSLKYDVGAIARSKTLRKKVVDLIKKMNAGMYALILNDALTDNNYEQSVIDTMTSEEDSTAISFLLASMLFGNSYQSQTLKPFSLNNEQFKQLATFAGNFSRLTIEHSGMPFRNWLKTYDPNYDTYTALTAAELTGYRRIYIGQPNGSNVSGTVKDASGAAVASFKNGILTSSSDQWIRITASDAGNWLRLPIYKDYLVEFSLSKDAKINLKVADYSVGEGKVVRTVRNDNTYNWTGLNAKAADQYTLNIPSAEKTNSGYDLTSAYYSLSIKKGSAAVPKLKNVKVKAASKGFKVSWTKLSAAQQKNVTKIQIQYSTSKKFKQYKTVYASKSSSSKKITGLKKGKIYYVRVRNIKYLNDKKSASKWSAVKKVKTK